MENLYCLHMLNLEEKWQASALMQWVKGVLAVLKSQASSENAYFKHSK